ncbi:MAG: hypothetical protein PHC54_06835 [Candidatus Omnitrophica bacterium]|nr:hypothetical protein [Candidatus Omnitrophota bacterium]MDD5592943.1 hypothetical protein [Candidatus Omnitrophota bacterium]
MEFNSFDLLASGSVFLIYGTTCILSVIFTFSLDTYRDIEEKLGSNVLSSRILSPLDRNIDWLNSQLARYNKISGPVLILFSLFNLNSLFGIINNVYLWRP